MRYPTSLGADCSRDLFPVLLINCILFLFLHLLLLTAKANLKFDACEPESCGHGGPIISFPFWIPLVHKNYCGYPGYEVGCIDNETTLLFSDAEYLIKDIFYGNRSLLVVDIEAEEAESSKNSCSVPLQNFTLDGTPFQFGHTPENLFFFYNCSKSINSAAYQSFQINCSNSSSVTGNRSYAVFEQDLGWPDLNYTLQTCKSTVSTAVDIDTSSKGVSSYSDYLLSRGGGGGGGLLLKWSENTNCSQCKASGGRCRYYQKQFLCLCPNGSHAQFCTTAGVDTDLSIGAKVGIGFGAVMFTVLAILGFIGVWKKRKTGNQNLEAFLKNYGSLAPKRYSYADIKKMTNSFKEKLGQGGYGSVFKGKLEDGRLVAVKVLKASKGNGEEFINEVASIGRTSHLHIVTFLGFCLDGSKKALIYEFMSNGSLEKFIYNKKSANTYTHLGWDRLYQIAVGIAKGLEYLHGGYNTRIVHFDIKPHNILLDKDFCPKISDFGLAKLCHQKNSIISMMGLRGTIGYIAPEVFSRNFGGVSPKSDVYSYGMMILEMVGGRKNFDDEVDHTSENYFPDWIYEHIRQNEYLKLDVIMREKDVLIREEDVLMREEEEHIVRKMIMVGLWCIQMDPKNRPSIRKVVEMLEGNLESLPMPPKPFFSSPPRLESFSISTS